MTVWRSATVSEQTAITATSRPGLWMVALLTPDVARALIARGWFMDGELVLDVDDPFLGEHNRYLLTVRGGKADCVPTDREPDLSLDVSDLGSVYLGGTAPSTLVRAGHIRAHHQCAAAPADALFRIERTPTACTGSDRPHPLHNARARKHPDMQPMGVRFSPVGDPATGRPEAAVSGGLLSKKLGLELTQGQIRSWSNLRNSEVWLPDASQPTIGGTRGWVASSMGHEVSLTAASHAERSPMSDLAGDASRRVVANSQAKYLYWILGGAGGTPVVLTLFSNPQQRWAILGVAAVAGVLACRYLTPVSVRLGPDTMVVHWPLRSVLVDADSLRLAKQSPTVAGRDTIAFRVRWTAPFNLVLNQFEDPQEILATIIRLVETATAFSGDRAREVNRLRKLG